MKLDEMHLMKEFKGLVEIPMQTNKGVPGNLYYDVAMNSG